MVIFLIFGVLNPNFLTFGNLRDIAVSASVNAIIGLGITFVIITGGIDLSVGSIASFVGIASATLMVNAGTSPLLGSPPASSSDWSAAGSTAYWSPSSTCPRSSRRSAR